MSDLSLGQQCLFIENEQGQRLYYTLRLAENPSESRTLFILHGHAHNKVLSGFSDKNWNVVCPVDNFGYDGKGSWWLGEHGDFFVKKLMDRLITRIKDQTKSSRLYFWGSSMGGYGAIFYGLTHNAEAVFANIPQIKLNNTQYTSHKELSKYFDYVVGQDYPHWVDLTSLLAMTPKYKYPLFLITQTRFHFANYLKEHIYYFTQKCDEYGANYFLEITPKEGHILYRNVAQSVAYFDEYESDIIEWKKLRDQEFKKNKFKDIYHRIDNSNDGKSLYLNLKLNSTLNVGSKDLLVSLKPECFFDDDHRKYGLLLSESKDIGVFKYITTVSGISEVSIKLDFPKNNYLEFAIKEFYPKGITIIEEMKIVIE